MKPSIQGPPPLSQCFCQFRKPNEKSTRAIFFHWHPSKSKKKLILGRSDVSRTFMDPRGDRVEQDGWIFGKLPNGLWPPHPIFGKLCCAFFGRPENLQRNSFGLAWPPPLFPKIHRFYPPKITEKTATKFFGSEMTPPPSEVFRKFIQNGPCDRPLPTDWYTAKISDENITWLYNFYHTGF